MNTKKRKTNKANLKNKKCLSVPGSQIPKKKKKRRSAVRVSETEAPHAMILTPSGALMGRNGAPLQPIIGAPIGPYCPPPNGVLRGSTFNIFEPILTPSEPNPEMMLFYFLLIKSPWKIIAGSSSFSFTICYLRFEYFLDM